LARYGSEIEFEFIGHDKNVPKMSVDTTNLETIVRMLDSEFRNYRFSAESTGFAWFTDATGACYAKVLSTGGIIAKFRIRTIKLHKIGGQ